MVSYKQNFVYLLGILTSPVIEQFTDIGKMIQLTCPDKKPDTWQKLESEDILASCEHGNVMFNTSILHKIHITKDCQNLTIKVFKKEDIGIYRCYISSLDAAVQMYDFDINIRSITIVEANHSSNIKRKEGEYVKLTCLLHGGQPDTVVYWTVGGTILMTNKSAYVTYQFTAMSTDHLKQFVCNANSIKPCVTIASHPNPPTVRKGHNITLFCQDGCANDEVTNNFSWTQNGRLINNNTNMLQFIRAHSYVTGEYICIVKNIAGENFDVVNVTVTYSPVVQNYNVTFKTNGGPITLKYEAKGVPNKYKFSGWRHFTHNDQLVRTIQGYKNGTLILPHHADQELTYENSGIYICNVTNGIPDEDGQLWKAGKVVVIIEGKPEKPTNIRCQSTTNQIHVEFHPGFDGGSSQKFIIEYRKASSLAWMWLEIEESFNHYCIKNLEPSTKYELRMYARNKQGNSTFTDVCIIFSKDEMSSSGTKYIGFVLLFTITVCILFTWWRLRKAKRHDSQRSRENEQQIQGLGVIVNNLYGSAADIHGSSSSASAGRTDVYSSIDRRKENLDKQEVTYKIAEQGKKQFQLTDRKGRKRHTESGSSKLNYINVVFEPKPHIGTFYIHGADNRTPYADIDFSAKAEPLSSSDENDESSTCGGNNVDDFVSLEDVQQWNITED
ncbi:unnamed protein product [Mytilus coruscus]|uniref:NCAM n=1 Tax=Mytilus coruscus TaxID=42192 RepID=A0A6J8EWL8_MYTCO|nr:unnamed protein product [Mytilus coruscus]